MKARLIERLDLLAEVSQTRWLEEIARQTKVLEQAGHQRQLLAAYRAKLRESWRGGGVIHAGAAKRAADFTAASHAADLQIEQQERQASQRLDRARQGFAETQERRRGLDAARREAALAAERGAAQRLERAQTGTPAKPGRPA